MGVGICERFVFPKRFSLPYTVSDTGKGRGRVLLRELLVDSIHVKDEQGATRTYDYIILIGERDTGPFFCESYGVKIMERGSMNLSAVPDVTTKIGRIDELMEILLRNEVLPGHLLDVIMDWL